MQKLNSMQECESELLRIKQESDCPHVRNEVNQLLCITMNYRGEIQPNVNHLAEVRERTFALLNGIANLKKELVEIIF
jgi:hypothetical protein